MNELEALDFEIENQAARLGVHRTAAASYPFGSYKHLNHTCFIELVKDELKALHKQRHAILSAMPKPTLPGAIGRTSVFECAECCGAGRVTWTIGKKEMSIVCMTCNPLFNKPVRVVEPECDYCGGDGWTERMRFGYGGGFSSLKPCPKCCNQ